jgi:hypothetical protein
MDNLRVVRLYDTDIALSRKMMLHLHKARLDHIQVLFQLNAEQSHLLDTAFTVKSAHLSA